MTSAGRPQPIPLCDRAGRPEDQSPEADEAQRRERFRAHADTTANWIARDLAAVLNRANEQGIAVSADIDEDGTDYAIEWVFAGEHSYLTVEWYQPRAAWIVTDDREPRATPDPVPLPRPVTAAEGMAALARAFADSWYRIYPVTEEERLRQSVAEQAYQRTGTDCCCLDPGADCPACMTSRHTECPESTDRDGAHSCGDEQDGERE